MNSRAKDGVAMNLHRSAANARDHASGADTPLTMSALLGRALRLACPLCGSGRMYSSWFTMRKRCEHCHFRFERGESDYFIGAYTIHLIVAELIIVAIMLVWMMITWPDVPWDAMLWGILGLSMVGITATFPFSRSIWLAIDLLFRPAEAAEYVSEEVNA